MSETPVLDLLASELAWGLRADGKDPEYPLKHISHEQSQPRWEHPDTFLLQVVASSLPESSWVIPKAMTLTISDVEGLSIDLSCDIVLPDQCFG